MTDTPPGRVLAIDVGGTKFAAAVVDRSGERHGSREVPTPADSDPDLLGTALTGLARDVMDDAVGPGGTLPVGVGSAGPIDLRSGTVSPVNVPAWRGYPIVDLLAPLAGRYGRPALAGDGQCFALAEAAYGAGRGANAVLGIVVSTGVGAGLVLSGRIHAGRTGNAGHLGHVSIDPTGPPCPCGNTGCLERYASGPSMVRHAQSLGWTPPAGQPADGKSLTTSAAAGDERALGAINRGADALARGIALTATLVELDRVVIGGGVSAAGELLLAPLRRRLEERLVLGYTRGVEVVPASLGRAAGLAGAAAHAFSVFDRRTGQ